MSDAHEPDLPEQPIEEAKVAPDPTRAARPRATWNERLSVAWSVSRERGALAWSHARRLALAAGRLSLLAGQRVVHARVWGQLASAVLRLGRRLLPVVRYGVRVAGLTLGLAALALGGGWLLLERVEPTSIGVRQARFGGGLEERDFEPGLHVGLRPFDSWYFLDARTHIVAFAHRSDGGSDPMLRVRTKDGNVARVAASVPYRIRAGEGHRLVAKGLRTTYPELVRATVKKTLLVEFAHLSSDDLCDTDTRTARVRETLPKLNQALAEYHVEAESIELRMVFFPQEYEQTLQKKQLSRQLGLLAEAEKELKDAERLVGQVEMEIEGAVQVLHAERKQEIARIVADHQKEIAPIQARTVAYKETRAAEAQAEYDRLVAEGEIALHEAEAERTGLLAAAYASPGGRLYLAREAAHRLRVKEVTLDSNDPRVPSMLDLDELVRLLVGGD